MKSVMLKAFGHTHPVGAAGFYEWHGPARDAETAQAASAPYRRERREATARMRPAGQAQ